MLKFTLFFRHYIFNIAHSLAISFCVQDEHKQYLEEILVAQAVPGIRSVMAMNDSLKQTLHRYHTLAEQVCVR